MNLTQITSADLRQILNLLEQKETLQARAATIDAELARLDSTESAEPAAPAPVKPEPKAPAEAEAKPGRVKRAERGALKAAIIDLLKAAGRPGLTVKDIAAKLDVKYSQAFTWFYNTGDKVAEIKKTGPATYAWVAAAPVAKPAAAIKPAAKAKQEKSSAKQPTAEKKLKLKDLVIGLVKASGKKGITVKEIAGKIGLEAQRIYVWFNGTGVNVKEIKKIAPGTYRWVA